MYDVNAVADSIFLSFKAFCAKEVERRVLVLERRISEIPAGQPGKDGVDGAPGPAGRDGADGKDGSDGIDGKDGAPGARGVDGAPGIDGKDGAAGVNGKDGRDGVDGKDGASGLDGKDGAPGERGTDGINGKDGVDGKDGKDGAPGLTGKDGAPGERGADGINGKDGVNGIDGKDGAPGLNGKDGAPGRDGVSGLKGDDGRDGRDGLEGPPGRDALRLDVLDGIDLERSYARGTYACYRGGTVRAFRNTDPMDVSKTIEQCGWQMAARGIAEVRWEQIDERTLKRIEVATDGRTFELVTVSEEMRHRGVWVEREYRRGDCVTHAGSTWHCERATLGQPSISDDWTLSNKRGRDGKDGKDGKPGERGLQGKPGRDFSNLGTMPS